MARGAVHYSLRTIYIFTIYIIFSVPKKILWFPPRNFVILRNLGFYHWKNKDFEMIRNVALKENFCKLCFSNPDRIKNSALIFILQRENNGVSEVGPKIYIFLV